MWWQKLALLSVLVIICVVRGNPLYNNPKFLADEPTSYRLPKNSVPISYEIILKPNIEADDFTIEGQVNIKIRIVEDTDKITIHSRDLLITKIEIFNASSSDLIISDASFDPVTTHDFIVIDLENTYGSGTELRIDITYDGELRNDGAGFYRGSYNNSQGETKFYGATQFEILDARSAFPCYDEPGIRAVMTLTIIHDVSLTAIANMEESSKTLSSDETKYITQFQPTPPMQTYLLAFLVSDFEFIEAINTRVPQKIYGTPVSIQDGHANFTAAIVGPILAKFEEKLGVNYALDKMDHIALVTKFTFSGMENFGLITYADYGLLLNPALGESAKFNQESSIISLVTHEYAHQWFGDLVSPQWWQYTWLNEGFATFFANYLPDLIYPERKSMRNFFSSTIQAAFSNDDINAWSMNHYTDDPKELWTKFNRIGYQKSGCVIRMIMEVMTEPVFLKGLNYYLTENYMKAATPEELHTSLQRAYDEAFPEERLHIGDFMGTWENQAGYPLLTVKAGKDTLVFMQNRYPESKGEVYTVPITFAHKSNPEFSAKTKLWLPVATFGFTTEQTGYKEGDWLIVNIDQVGYYRVDYDKGLWHANIEQLNNNHQVINPLNRALLIDEFYLAWTEFNRVDATDALNILNYLDKEDEYLAWARGQATYNILRNRLFGTAVYEKFTEFIRSKTMPHLEVLGYEGFDGEDPNRISLRSYTKQCSCQLLDGNCYLLEYQKLIAYLNDGGEVNFNYCHAMKLLDEPIYSQIVLGVSTNSDYANREGFVQNLGCTLNPVNLNVLLLQILNTGNILSNTERENILISMFSSSEEGLKTTLNFIDVSHGQINTMVDLSKIMSSMAEYINGKPMTAKFREVLTKLKTGQHLTEENYQSISKIIESNEKWINNNYQKVFDYFNVIIPTTYRLPKDSIPINYDIILNSNIKEGDFGIEGTVNIKIEIVEDTDKITIHSSGLDITKIDVVDILSMNQIIADATFQYVKSHDFLVIYLDNTFSTGKELRLDIYYKSKLRDDGAGFYWASYNNSQGEIKYYGATQFEVIDARSAFPCYDEPGIRAVMTLTIIHDKSLNAVSNTEVSTQLEDITKTKYITQFKPTPKMQTYLLAFLVSDFEYVEATNSRIPQKIYATPMAIQDGQGNFSAGVVGPILHKLEEVLGVDYPLSKMDHAALTKFNFGAMENFGLITYIDRGLLLNPALSENSKYNQQGSIISLVTHEFAHQWFGDIVSPNWWQYTWLNEGFATFFANYIPSLVYPERQSMRSFFSSTIQTAFNNDGPNAWSMNHYTEQPNELWSKFGGIGYQKSGCVIRMVMEVITEPVFLKGLNYYLTDNYMKAATPEELHASLQKAYDEAFPEERLHIGDFMRTWENQAGYPLLTVTVSGSNLVFSQRRYPQSSGELYTVPITFATKTNADFNNRSPKVWLPLQTLTVDQAVNGYNSNDWMIVNIDQVGYYRVDYDTVLWHANIEQLNNNHKIINPLNRALLLDEFYLAWTEFNRVNAIDALNILNYFDKEDEYLAWARGQATYNILKNRLFGTEVFENFATFIRSKTRPHLENLGYEGIDGEDPNRISLRSYTKQWSCQSLDGNCYLLEYQKLIAYSNGGGEVNFNYCYAMKLLDEPIYAQIVLGITTNSNYANRAGFVQNLGCTLNPVNLDLLLLQVVNSENILSSAERENILISMFSSSKIGLETALKFIGASYTQIKSMVDLSKIMSNMAGYINGEEMTTNFREVLDALKAGEHITEENHQSISSILESNEAWIRENYQRIFNYLDVNYPTTYRLPKNSIPISYDIIINPNIKEGDFSLEGTVNIKIEIVEDTDKITIHSSGLDVTKIDVVDILSMNQIVSDATFQHVKSHDFLVIYLDNTYSTGTELRLDIYYKGKLRDDSAGFFWASYNNSQGEIKYYGATQFEVIDARSAFPCYDEPGIRAVMTLTIIHDKSLNAVSNTEVSTQLEDTTKTKYITQFKPTPKMQTYLLAFLVSDFENVEATNSRIPQKIYATPMAIQDGQGNFSAGVVGPILQKLEEVLGVDYPLSKMDHAALTKFRFSAMENIGLITYVDQGLLVNPDLNENSKFNQENSIITLITHEYAHQWFGNIISPKWWQYTWLNEGFATFFGTFIPSLVYPERISMRNFFSYIMPTAFNSDGITAWSMNQYTEDPNRLWDKFDGIGYDKSSCIVRMIMEVMTESVFLKGLNYYLTENYMKAATPVELHTSLQRAYNEAFPEQRLHIGDFMGTWENQAGFPLLTVEADKDKLVFSQRRYPQNKGEVYSIPISFAHKSNPDSSDKTPKLWLPVASSEFTTEQTGYKEGDWLIVNIDQVGYYRVDYDTALWRANIEQLNNNHQIINELNRALLLDEFYLAWTEFNRVNGGDALNILSYFDKEDEYLAWARGQATYNILRNRLFGTAAYEKFTEFIRSKTMPHLEVLGYEGFDGENANRMSLRSYIKQWSCQSLDGNCIIQDYQKLIAYYNNGGEPNFNFCYAMELLDESIFAEIVHNATTQNEYPYREGFVRNLGCSRNPVNLNILQEQVLNVENNLSKDERQNILITMFSSSEVGLAMAINFIESNHIQLSSSVDLSMIMSVMSAYINGEEKTEKFRSIAESLKSRQVLSEEHDQSIKNTLDANEKWIKANYYEIALFFGLIEPSTTLPPTSSTTTTTPGYISSSTTSKPQDPTTTSQRPTDPPTTTPDSGNSLFISIGLIIICTVMNSMRLF